MLGKKHRCRKTLLPPSGLGCCSRRNSTSGSAVWVQSKTAPEQISKSVLRGQRHPCPQIHRREPPAQPCLLPSPSLPGLLICQGSSLRCRMQTVEPSSACCHGNVKHSHLPIPVPTIGQHPAQAAGFLGEGLCLPSHSSEVHPTSSSPPAQLQARAQHWLALLLVQGAAGAVTEGGAGVSKVVSLHFLSFTFRAFLFPFLALPSPVARQGFPLPSEVHQCRQKSGLCRATGGAWEDKMLSCTGEQFLFELRWEEVRAEPLAGRESNWAAASLPVLSPSSWLTGGFLQESPFPVCPKMQICPGQMQSIR